MKTSPLVKGMAGQPSPKRQPEKGTSARETLLLATKRVSAPYDLVCFSHLRWDFVFQRPQHLLSRFARERRVFYVEEPIFDAGRAARLELSRRENGVWLAVPHLPEGLSEAEGVAAQKKLMDELFATYNICEYALWYYTPMALPFSRHLKPLATVYDCMDELSTFAEAPTNLGLHERELFARADLVFTGGQSLYEAKRHQHGRVYAFPSSIDVAHFAQARGPLEQPHDQAAIPRPRLGFYGVIDERMDLELLAGLADARPDWHLVIVGPVAVPKFDPKTLPHRPNIHYLGGRSYGELPGYLAGWDAALLPFARNEATRFISPTKTPEYLAAGKRVVSTSIRDVVRPYAQEGLVEIADTVEAFVAALEAALNDPDRDAWLGKVDSFLAHTSWDLTWAQMARLIDDTILEKEAVSAEMNAGGAVETSAHGND